MFPSPATSTVPLIPLSKLESALMISSFIPLKSAILFISGNSAVIYVPQGLPRVSSPFFEVILIIVVLMSPFTASSFSIPLSLSEMSVFISTARSVRTVPTSSFVFITIIFSFFY